MLLGLAMSCGFVLMAFNLSTEQKPKELADRGWKEDEKVLVKEIYKKIEIIKPEVKKEKIKKKVKEVIYIPVEEPVEKVELIDTDIDAEDIVVDKNYVITDTVFSIPSPLPKADLPEENNEPEEVIRRAQTMPMFPGCEQISDLAERQICAEGKLMAYIANNIDYPEIAIENNISGTVHIEFVVEKDGTVSSTKILRDAGAGLGKEAVRTVNSMNSMSSKWSPGINHGKIVRTSFILPVKFNIR